MRKKPLELILGVGLAMGIGLCLYVIAVAEPTPRESLLLAFVLTILSILGSWIAARVYSKVVFNESLHVFARKAAEKVDNLSNELDRLAFSSNRLLPTKTTLPSRKRASPTSYAWRVPFTSSTLSSP